NSLNTVLGFSESDIFDRKMKKINHSGKVMLNLVTNMLDVQKFEEAKFSLNKTFCKISEVVEEARQQVSLLFQEKSLSFKISIQYDYTLNCDWEIMVRVFVNLLSNAAKYSKPGRNVSLLVAEGKQDGFLQASVIDEGMGIPQAELLHVFDKYWQGDAKMSGKVASTGLGLTFCKLAVEAHNGNIAVKSTEGKGSSFIISLPAEEVVAAPGLEISSDHHSANTLIDVEIPKIKVYASQLKEKEVYQVGEIIKLLDEMAADGIESDWKKAVESAVRQGDSQRYSNLLSEVLSS
ncbi:MAG: HAMP domain-containing sensor histidine kinase, partial [Bacteroidota bacterium]